MITLGTMDSDVHGVDVGRYLENIHERTMLERKGHRFRGEQNDQWLAVQAQSPRTVRQLQQFLKNAGFFPFGAVDGLYGYRTHSSMRLFQEYVRTVEGDPAIGSPDGAVGNNTRPFIERWQTGNRRAEWVNYSAENPQPEYRQWMALLHKVKAHYLSHPTAMLKKVDAHPGASDTLRVSEWDFDPHMIHFIGIRRNEAIPGQRVNDDVYVLLINGMVFKFYGTTDPGKASPDASSAPFLVHGQHKYRFGWHKMRDMTKCYLALKPLNHGVLVIRSGERNNPDLTEADILSRKPEANQSINVHWGGIGTSNWSNGCQVICGKGYINHRGQRVDCTPFAAIRYQDLGVKNARGFTSTRGAYSVLVDLVAAFSGDVHRLNYMLLYERDLDLDPAIGAARAERILSQLN